MPPTIRVPVHPGEILREEFVVPYGMTQQGLAERLDISRRRVNELLNEKRAVTADTALRLAKLFRTSPEFWMNLQAGYNLAVAAEDTELGGVRPVRKSEQTAAAERGLDPA